MKPVPSRDVRILLHDIRSVYNAGAIFRTADAIGASRIYLTGFTPAPLDRFGNPRADFAKCALGSEWSVPWESGATASAVMRRLAAEGFKIVCVEQSPKSVDYKGFDPGTKTLVVFGNEVSGIPKSILAKADAVAEIPMRGMKESLNVSVSAGIVLFRWFDR